jgi:hypothetical protein
MMEHHHFAFSNFEQVFGKLQSVHRVGRSKSETIIVLSATLFLFLLGGVSK